MGMHGYPGGYPNHFKKLVNDGSHIALLGIKQEGHVRQIRSGDGTNVTTAHRGGRWPQHQQFFFKQRQDRELFVGDGERDKPQVELALQEAGDDLLWHPHRDLNLSLSESLSYLSPCRTKAVDERCNA